MASQSKQVMFIKRIPSAAIGEFYENEREIFNSFSSIEYLCLDEIFFLSCFA